VIKTLMKTTTRERIREVASVFAGRPGTGIHGPEDFIELLRMELGHEDALDRPVFMGGVWQKAVAPSLTYHICAANLAVSAETALALGLVLGGDLVFKLPSGGLEDFIALVDSLPPGLRLKVRLLDVHDPELMARAEAVVVFGGEDAVGALHREVRWDQRFLAYGPKISLGWVLSGTASEDWTLAAAKEIRAFGQRGCLSPHSYLCVNHGEANLFGKMLAEALDKTPGKNDLKPSVESISLVREARKRAQIRGDRVLVAEEEGNLDWTVVVRNEVRIEAGPGCGFVEVLPSQDLALFEEWRGKISAVSITSDVCPEKLWEQLASCGVSRVCRMGELQNPPLLWRHDGQPRLSPLVRWIACDPGVEVSP
jgi:hypothetical protein